MEQTLAEIAISIDDAKTKTRQVGDEISILDEALRGIETQLRQDMLWVPNLPHESVPTGPDDSFNIAYDPKGSPLPQFDFEPKAHWDLGPELDIIDFERESKLSGTRFYLLRGWGARLQRALIQFMLDQHISNHGYLEIYPPYMVRSQMFEGAAQLPKFADNIYRDAEEDYMWLGTGRDSID